MGILEPIGPTYTNMAVKNVCCTTIPDKICHVFILLDIATSLDHFSFLTLYMHLPSCLPQEVVYVLMPIKFSIDWSP